MAIALQCGQDLFDSAATLNILVLVGWGGRSSRNFPIGRTGRYSAGSKGPSAVPLPAREGGASEKGQRPFPRGAGIRRISGGGCQDKARPAVFLWSAVDLVPFTQAQDQETPVSVLDIAEETQVAEKIAPECSQGAAQGLAQVSGVIPESEASLESRSSTFNENRPKE